MAKNSCPACGAPVSRGEEFCSYCGALIPHNTASAAAAVAAESAPAKEVEGRRVQTPQTIEELLAFCERHELPLAKMRFFIGLDYPGAKAYGIYKDEEGQFVVYKNKADGSRAVRYRGPDEAHAVKELFDKLKEEATGQRARVAAVRTGGAGSAAQGGASYVSADSEASLPRQSKRRSNKLLIGILALAAAITIGRAAVALHRQNTPSTGYYQYHGDTYYSQNDHWYLYDSYGGWYPIYSIDDELLNHYGDYYSSYSYDEDYGVESFADSQYYDYSAGSTYDSSDYDGGSSWSWDWDDDDSWDSSDDWDWDSDWDSDWSDWDSDW